METLPGYDDQGTTVSSFELYSAKRSRLSQCRKQAGCVCSLMSFLSDYSMMKIDVRFPKDNAATAHVRFRTNRSEDQGIGPSLLNHCFLILLPAISLRRMAAVGLVRQ